MHGAMDRHVVRNLEAMTDPDIGSVGAPQSETIRFSTLFAAAPSAKAKRARRAYQRNNGADR